MPSVWLNSNPCFQSTVSFLKHFPTAKNFAGNSEIFKLASVCADKQVVCVLKTSFLAFSSSHLYLQPELPATPSSCASLTAFTNFLFSESSTFLSIKKVSCISRTGWSCAVNKASKFQKEL